jgi:fructose-specific component phosphotransferase system IIB-like protein
MKIIVDEILGEYVSFDENNLVVFTKEKDIKQAMKEFAEKVLGLAAEKAKVEYTQDNEGFDLEIVNKESITSVINQIEF